MTASFHSSSASHWCGMPRWLVFTLSTILLWGIWGFTTKLVSAQLDTSANQVLFTLGLLPLMLIASRSARGPQAASRSAGRTWAFVTGLLGSLGNIAFFQALVRGGRVSIVGPVTALFPLVTVILALTLLHERLSLQQIAGFVLALAAIYLLIL